MRLISILTGLIALASVPGTANAVLSAGRAVPTLYVTCSPGQITIMLANGTAVGTSSAPGTVIPPGTYDVDVTVASGNPQFQISGPGVQLLDGETAEEVFTETFAPSSTYTYEDSDAPRTSQLVFSTSGPSTAISSGATVTPPSGGHQSSTDIVGSAIASTRGTLAATLSAAGALTLTDHGKAVSSIEEGRYRFAIEDRDSKRGLTLRRRIGHPVVLSGVSFVGKRSMTVELEAGRWSYSAGTAAKRSFTVSA